ncbi:hypothetical protein GCM10012319_44620 [Comamonas sp. KCTC 72670]|nr:hypothetical protein GCM10012319_44620 [Comamonas sp. KCTC 72670]
MKTKFMAPRGTDDHIAPRARAQFLTEPPGAERHSCPPEVAWNQGFPASCGTPQAFGRTIVTSKCRWTTEPEVGPSRYIFPESWST